MTDTTSQADPTTIYVPREAKRQLLAELSEDDRREYEANHTGRNGAVEEWILREAVLPWMMEQLGYDPSRTKLTVKGDFTETRSRNEDGTFTTNEE
jgi:hypothetical protein